MAITKQIDEHGNVYSIDDRGDGTVIQLKSDPTLTYEPPPTTVPFGETLSVMFQLRDFDGEPRNDTRPVVFIIDGEEVSESLVDGQVTLEIECLARGPLSIGVAPAEITLRPVTIEVV